MRRGGRLGAILATVVVVATALLAVFIRRINSPQRIEVQQKAESSTTDSLFTFDPNTVSYEQLLALGFERHTAVS